MNKEFLNIKKEYPILNRGLLKKNLVYLDSAATTQKPQVVIDRLCKYYTNENANIHRGPYDLSVNATKEWEKAHEIVADFINANSYKEVIFVRNTTEGLNFLANSVGRKILNKGDIVVVSEMEHHSNIVPWMILQKEIGFKIEYIPVNDNYTLDLEWFKDLVRKEEKKIKIVSLVHISNVLGVKNDVKLFFDLVPNAFKIVDAAQSVARTRVDVKEMGCDALVFSGHKVYAPMGSGALYVNEKYIKNLDPWMGGGEMISSVKREGYELNDIPWRFEAGTPNVADGIALGVALEWLMEKVDLLGGWKAIEDHEHDLVSLAFKQFEGIDWFQTFGPKDPSLKYGAIAFNVKGFVFRGCKNVLNMESSLEGSSISDFLNESGIAFREGYHCAEPLHDKFCVGPTLRFSLGIYTTEEDIKYACNKLKEAVLRGASR